MLKQLVRMMTQTTTLLVGNAVVKKKQESPFHAFLHAKNYAKDLYQTWQCSITTHNPTLNEKFVYINIERKGVD